MYRFSEKLCKPMVLCDEYHKTCRLSFVIPLLLISGNNQFQSCLRVWSQIISLSAYFCQPFRLQLSLVQTRAHSLCQFLDAFHESCYLHTGSQQNRVLLTCSFVQSRIEFYQNNLDSHKLTFRIICCEDKIMSMSLLLSSSIA